MFKIVPNINKNAHQIIAKRLALVPPQPSDRLRLRGNRSESLLQFQESFGDKIIGHRPAVIEPKRQQNLVAPE